MLSLLLGAWHIGVSRNQAIFSPSINYSNESHSFTLLISLDPMPNSNILDLLFADYLRMRQRRFSVHQDLTCFSENPNFLGSD
jgi:hypothetical protein